MFQQEKTNGVSRMKNANARKGAAVVAIVLGLALTACSDGGSSSSSGGKQGWSLTLKYSEDGSTDSPYSLVSRHWWPWGGTYAKTECVKDSRTGLVWEGKTASGLRAGSNRYTNYDSTSSGQKWDGSNPTQAEIDASTNSIGYVKAVNASALCGFTDWRLPTPDELLEIVESSKSPTIDTFWFPNTQTSYYWSSSPYVGFSGSAWSVLFYNGYVYCCDFRLNGNAVRLVRASQ